VVTDLHGSNLYRGFHRDHIFPVEENREVKEMNIILLGVAIVILALAGLDVYLGWKFYHE